MRDRIRAVVVGAGLLGLSAARELAIRGHTVTVLEQAAGIGHVRSGSKGTTRIFRTSYDDPFYVRLARRSRPGWDLLAAEAGTELLVETGLLSFGGDLGQLASAVREWSAAAAPSKGAAVLTAREVERLFPEIDPPGEAVWEAEAGVLLTDRILAALASTPGVDLEVGRRVLSFDDGGGRVTVTLEDGVLECDRVVVCAGGYTGEFLGASGNASLRRAGAAVTASLQQVAYFQRSGPSGVGVLPAVVDRGRRVPYGLAAPSAAGALDCYKVGVHVPGSPVDLRVAPLVGRVEDVEYLTDCVAQLLPNWVRDEARDEVCCYDDTPGEDFIVDRVGNVVVGAGTSGHGFKFGPVFGEMLADLVEGRELRSDVRRRLSATGPRFA